MPSNIINIVDFELTCNGEEEDDKFFNEIVEIGIVGLNVESRSIEYKDSILVKPEKSFITPYFTNLTGIQEEEFNDALRLKKAITYLQNNFLVRKRIWMGYGRDDLALLKNCKIKGITYPFCDEYINIYSVLSMQLGYFERQSLLSMMEKQGLEFEGTQHRALDDAYNTARLFMKVFWEK